MTFDITGSDDDPDVALESIIMPTVISSVTPAAAWSGNGGYVNSYDASVQNAAQRVIHLGG